MFDSFWNDFRWKIFFSCFVPYLLYFSCALFYILLMLFVPEEHSEQWEMNTDDLGYLQQAELPLRILLIILWLFHATV